MIKGEYKNILFEMFDVLGFSGEEKEKALETFKKKLAFELLKEVQGELPQDQKEWLRQPAPDMGDPKFAEIQNAIKSMYTSGQLHERAKPIFRKLLEDYVNFMSQDLNAEEISKLNGLLVKF